MANDALSERNRHVITVDCDADVPPALAQDELGHVGHSFEWEVFEHRKMGKINLEKRADGKLYANGIEIVTYLSPRQQIDDRVHGYELYRELTAKPVLNAHVLDALLKHDELIPDAWRPGTNENYSNSFSIFFWGTLYRIRRKQSRLSKLFSRDKETIRVVRSLSWYRCGCDESGTYVVDGLTCQWKDFSNRWGIKDPAAVLGS